MTRAPRAPRIRFFSGSHLACLAGALCAIGTASRADEVPVTLDGNLVSTARSVAIRDGLVNPGNLLQQPDGRLETALIIEGRAFDVRYRVRAPVTATHIDEATTVPWRVAHDPTLQELARDVDVGQDTTLTVGKTNLVWDVGYASRPLGFFDRAVDLSDIEDRLRRTEGQPLIAASHIGDGWDATAVVARDIDTARDGYQRGLTQWALKGGAQVGMTSLTAVVQQPKGERIGMGMAATHAIGNDLELHGSLFARKGTRRPIHHSLLTGEIRYYGPEEEPVDEWRRTDERWYPRWVAGGQWTSESLVNVIVEWVHDSQGLSARQWETLKSLATFHRQGAPGLPRSAIDGNLSDDARTFLIEGVRQDYLFVRLQKGGNDWEPSASAFIGLADGSASLNARLTYTGAETWQAWLEGRLNVGPDGSEFRLVPEAGYIGAAFRYIF